VAYLESFEVSTSTRCNIYSDAGSAVIAPIELFGHFSNDMETSAALC